MEKWEGLPDHNPSAFENQIDLRETMVRKKEKAKVDGSSLTPSSTSTEPMKDLSRNRTSPPPESSNLKGENFVAAVSLVRSMPVDPNHP